MLLYQLLCPEDFGDAPCLCDTAAGAVGRVAVEYLADESQPGVGQMIVDGQQPVSGLCHCQRTMTVDFQVRLHKRPKQERPDRPLVIRPISLVRWPGASLLVAPVVRAQRPQAVRRQQLLRHCPHHRALLVPRQRAVWQRDRKYLIRPHRFIPTSAVNAVKKAAGLLIPERLGKSGGHQGGPIGVAASQRRVNFSTPVGHYPVCAVPQGINFDGLAMTRGHRVPVRGGIHPGKLGLFRAAGEQPVGVGVYVELRAGLIGGEYLVCSRHEQLGPEVRVGGGPDVPLGRDDEPQRGVDTVVVGRPGIVVEAIGYEPSGQMGCERPEDCPGCAEAPGGQQEARQRQHRIPAPVGEPVESGQDGGRRPRGRKVPPGHEGFGGHCKSARALVGGWSCRCTEFGQSRVAAPAGTVEVRRTRLVEAGGKLTRLPVGQLVLERARGVQVLRGVLASFQVHAVKKVVPPVGPGYELCLAGQQVQLVRGWARLAHRHAVDGRLECDAGMPAGEAEMVEVAQGCKWTHAQRGGAAAHGVANGRGVGGLGQHNLFYQLQAAGVVNEGRRHAVAELGKVRHAPRRKDPGKLVGCQFISQSAYRQFLHDRGQGRNPSHGRGGCRHQKTVVAARVAADDG